MDPPKKPHVSDCVDIHSSGTVAAVATRTYFLEKIRKSSSTRYQ